MTDQIHRLLAAQRREYQIEVQTADTKFFIRKSRDFGVIYSDASEDYYRRRCRYYRDTQALDAQDAREQAFEDTLEKYRR